MGIWIMRFFKKPKKVQPSQDMLAQILPSFNTRPPVRGTREFLLLWRTSPWIRAVVSKIAFSVSTVEWQAFVKRGNQSTLLQDHPVLTLLSMGGGQQSYALAGRSCLELTQKHLDLAGESFWVLERNGAGIPTGFVPLAPHWVVDIAKPGNERYKINIPNGGWQGDISAQDIIFFKDIDPLNPYERGAGAAEALADEINTDEFAAKHISSFLANRARPDVVISGSKDSTIPPEAVSRLEQTWLSKFGGPNRQGKPFVSSGPLSVQTITHDFAQLQLKDIRAFERDLIVSVFGIPPEKIGILTSSNRSTIEAADQFFSKDTIYPRLTLIRDTLNNQLCPQFDINLKLNFVSPVQEDKDFTLKVMQSAPHAFSLKDWRRFAGLEVLEDGSQDVYFIPFNLQPTKTPEDPFKINTSTPEKSLTFEKTVINKQLSEKDIVSISESLDDPQVKADITKLIEALRQELVLLLGQKVMEEIGDNLVFERNLRVASFITQTTAEKITKIDETTKDRVKNSLKQAITDNLTFLEIVNAVESIFDNTSRSRTIAQTESTQIASFSSNEAITQAGIKQREWLTTRDTFERPSHADMDGQIRHVGDPFVSGNGYLTDGPGMFGIAEEDINCRCAVVAYFEGTEERSKEQKDLLWAKRDRDRQVAENKYFTMQRKVFNIQKDKTLEALRRYLNE